MPKTPPRKHVAPKFNLTDIQREALEADLKAFIDNYGKLADVIPIRGLNPILKAHSELKDLLFYHARDAHLYAVLSSLVTQSPYQFETEWHDFLGTSLKENLTIADLKHIGHLVTYREQDKTPYPRKPAQIAEYSYRQKLTKLLSNLSHQMMPKRFKPKAKQPLE